MTGRIAILDDYAAVALDYADWSGLGPVTVFRDTLSDPDALIARLEPFEVLCIMRERTPLPGHILRALPNLRLIVTSGVRNQAIDLPTAQELGITVCGTDMRGTTTAEFVMASLLTLTRRILPEAGGMATGGWQTGMGRDLHGLTLGLIGLGKVGQRVAALAKPFGMTICAWSQNLTADRAAEHGVACCDSLPALMAASDVVSVHVLLSDRTRGLIGAEAFAAMRPGAAFLNTSRGPIVDSAALLAGLRAGRPAQAALDVYDTEPLPADDPLRDADLIASGRLLLTPHLGYASEQTFRLFYTQMAEAVAAWRAGAPIRLLS
jgi:phosphoglycerate dehydrogenase-like enzyme